MQESGSAAIYSKKLFCDDFEKLYPRLTVLKIWISGPVIGVCAPALFNVSHAPDKHR
jgi:hypothetical protein